MSNKSEINQELVKAFNSILCFDSTAVTNFTVESVKRSFFLGFFFPKKEDHIVISFDKNMSISQCMEYLEDMEKKVKKRFCPDDHTFEEVFYTEFFPFNSDQGKWTEDNRFLVPIGEKVISNIKYLLANDLAQFTINILAKKGWHQDYMDYRMLDENFNKKSYLYCASFSDKELQNAFVDSFLSEIKGNEDVSEKKKNFLEIKKDRIYIKKNTFDDPKFIKDIVRHRVTLICRDFRTSSSENRNVGGLKFIIIDLIRAALPHLPINDMWHTSHINSKDEYSILAPVINRGEYMGFLNEREVDHINNKVFGGTEVLCDLKDFIAQKGLLIYSQRKIYAIDFANVDISYCVMDKIIESSVINQDRELSVNPARVPAMQLPPKTLPFPEEDRDEVSGDSDLGNSLGKASTSFNRVSVKRKSPKCEQSDASIGGHGVQHGIKRTPLTASKRKELHQHLKPELQKKLDSRSFPLEQEKMLYLLYVDKRELRLLLSSSSPETLKQEFPSLSPEHIEQILSDGLSLEKKENLLFKYCGFDREIDSGISSASSSEYPRSKVEESNTTQEFKTANQAVNRPF